MKIVIDVDKLLQEGRITGEEYARLKALAVQETGSLAFNLLIGFGVIATAGGALALLPSSATAILLGLILVVGGIFLQTAHAKEWGLLGSMLLLIGAIMTAGGIVVLTEGGFVGFLVVTLLCLVGAVLAKSSLLAAMAALSLSATVGAATAYGHATYELVIRQPTVTVVLFGLLAWGAYLLSLRLKGDDERLAIVFARTSLFLVNLGFWVGSLFGDSLWHQQNVWAYRSGEIIPDWVFVIGWAVGLIATGVWAARRNKRWVVNLLAVFGAIHFYTQYFERLGAEPGSIMVAGLVALGIAFAIVRYNKAAKAAVPEKEVSPNKSLQPTGAAIPVSRDL
jgi:iron complex transport system permease protein